MSTARVDFLFRGSHPAFFWAAALMKKKGKSVAIFPETNIHSWEVFPSEVLEFFDLEELKTDRDLNPIQILATKCRLGIYHDLELTKKDFSFCTGNSPSPELNRGLSFYAKGSDYPVVFGESSSELLPAVHRMEYFEKPASEIQAIVTARLKKLGVVVISDDRDLPIAEQTIILDSSRAKILRTKFEFTVPMKQLPIGASNRMVFVERNSPLVEMVHKNGVLHVRTLLPEEPELIEKVLKAINPYFLNEPIKVSEVSVVPPNFTHQEWTEQKSYVDSSKVGIWLISPAINPELGERSLYVRISELLRLKFKKQQVFGLGDLFLS